MKRIKEILPTRKRLLGGGTLSRKRNLEGLERFNKNKKQKRIIIGSIIGIFVVAGSIALYRSYALYEEKKEFNVIRGHVPDFGYDIKMLSILVDEEKVETIPEKGNYKVEVSCDKGTGEWDYKNWKLSLNEFEKGTKCNITFVSVPEEEMPEQPNVQSVTMRHITGVQSDITIDVSNYSTMTFTLTVLHSFCNLYITADGNSVFRRLASTSTASATQTIDVSNISNIRIYTTNHETYIVKGFQLDITLS